MDSRVSRSAVFSWDVDLLVESRSGVSKFVMINGRLWYYVLEVGQG